MGARFRHSKYQIIFDEMYSTAQGVHKVFQQLKKYRQN